MYRIRYIIALLFMISGMSLPAQLIQVSGWLDSTRIRIGEQVNFNLEVKKNPDVLVSVGRINDSLLSGIEIVKADSVSDGGNTLIRWKYTLTSFDSGTHELPSVPVYFTCNEKKDTAYSRPVPLEVYLPEVDTTSAIKDIKPPINTPLSFGEMLPYLSVLAGAALIVGLILFLVRKYRKKKPEFTSPGKSMPAHVIAFSDLDKLKNDKLWQSGKVKQFYIRLSDIMRIYLENRYGFRAMEYITDEILSEFRKNNQENVYNEMLADILRTSDMVKFAKGDPLPAENQSNLDNAYLLVEKTKHVEIVSVEEMVREHEDDNARGLKENVK